VAKELTHRADELAEQNQSLIRAMQELQPVTSTQPRLTPALLDTGRRQLEQSIDWQEGGFGKAPKFPHVTSLEQLLRHWSGSRQRDQRALEMVTFTLRKMALGGINDQLGGGFCRYSVDDQWMIPHFEKMLYDNGPLLSLYTQAWTATQEPLFKQVIETTAQWVMREMQSVEGGYYSAQDADSEGEEGKFYAWTPGEIQALLEPEEYQAFARRFGLDREANFEDKWYPHVVTDWEALATELSTDEEQLRHTIKLASDKLFTARELRIRPGTDDKILTSWNALMIKGMAMAGRQLQRPDLITSAEQALEFIRNTLWKDGRLLATYKDGRAHLNAYLDDYAFLIDAILELLQSRWRDGDLDFAIQLCDTMLNHFEDKEHGGFYFTADDHEQLIQRLKPLGDESIPSGNGKAAFALARMGHLLAESRYLEASERTLHTAWPSMEQLPYAHNSLLMALEEQLYPPQTIILRGTEKDTLPWLHRCQQQYAPRRMIITIPNEATDLPGILKKRRGDTGKVMAYVCSGTSCSAPATSPEELERQLDGTEPQIRTNPA
jgi:uncharacterized protein YyaL (SSP411 family)